MRRPLSIWVIVVLFTSFAIIYGMVGLKLLKSALEPYTPNPQSAIQNEDILVGMIRAFLVGLGIAFFFGAVLSTIAATGIFACKGWARNLGFFVAFLSIPISSLLPRQGHARLPLVATVVAAGVILYLLGFDRATVAAFKKAPAPPSPGHPAK